MKRNFTFWKYRIKQKNFNLNFIDTFSNLEENGKPKDNIIRVKSLINNKIKIIPCLKMDKPNNGNNNNNKIKPENNPDLPNIFPSPNKNNKLKIINNDINNVIIKAKNQDNINNTINSTQKKKTKLPIPINKAQVKPLRNLNQNYVININNNINNSYQIKMDNNNNMNKNKSNNYDFAKIKIIQSEDGNKNCNTSNQKTVLTEISDISCFKSNKKMINLNSINSFVNNDNDFLSFSDDTNLGNNIKNNFEQDKKSNNDKNSNKKIKKIYINPDDFKAFCQEIEEKLNL